MQSSLKRVDAKQPKKGVPIAAAPGPPSATSAASASAMTAAVESPAAVRNNLTLNPKVHRIAINIIEEEISAI